MEQLGLDSFHCRNASNLNRNTHCAHQLSPPKHGLTLYLWAQIDFYDLHIWFNICLEKQVITHLSCWRLCITSVQVCVCVCVAPSASGDDADQTPTAQIQPLTPTHTNHLSTPTAILQSSRSVTYLQSHKVCSLMPIKSISANLWSHSRMSGILLALLVRNPFSIIVS